MVIMIVLPSARSLLSVAYKENVSHLTINVITTFFFFFPQQEGNNPIHIISTYYIYILIFSHLATLSDNLIQFKPRLHNMIPI